MRSALVVALGANAVLGQFMNASTGIQPAASLRNSSDTQPLVVGDFQRYGCAASTAGFPGFEKVASTEDMSLDFCAASCPSKFFGVYRTDCYCGDDIKPADMDKVGEGLCDTACPGNGEQTCGGLAAASRMARRQHVPITIALSLYIRIGGDREPSESGTKTDGAITATITRTTTATITSCPPEVTSCPIGHKTTDVVTVTTEICPTPEWKDKKIVCYGGNCAPEEPCNGDHCQRHRVICDDDHCRTEVCSNEEDWWKLIICKGDDCKYHQCTGDECKTKVICYDGKCAKEQCYGDECEKKFVCKGEECAHESCNGQDCHTNVACNGWGQECRPQPPCNGVGCPVPPPTQKPSPAPTPCTGCSPGKVVPVPSGPTGILPIQTGPPVVAGAAKAGVTVVGALFALLAFL